MKKQILVLAILAGIGSTTLISCGGENNKTEDKKEVAAKQYYCPMKCEGDKTYAEPGSCPKCGMDLVISE